MFQKLKGFFRKAFRAIQEVANAFLEGVKEGTQEALSPAAVESVAEVVVRGVSLAAGIAAYGLASSATLHAAQMGLPALGWLLWATLLLTAGVFGVEYATKGKQGVHRRLSELNAVYKSTRQGHGSNSLFGAD